jgi:hypothetical protein
MKVSILYNNFYVPSVIDIRDLEFESGLAFPFIVMSISISFLLAGILPLANKLFH